MAVCVSISLPLLPLQAIFAIWESTSLSRYRRYSRCIIVPPIGVYMSTLATRIPIIKRSFCF